MPDVQIIVGYLQNRNRFHTWSRRLIALDHTQLCILCESKSKPHSASRYADRYTNINYNITAIGKLKTDPEAIPVCDYKRLVELSRIWSISAVGKRSLSIATRDGVQLLLRAYSSHDRSIWIEEIQRVIDDQSIANPTHPISFSKEQLPVDRKTRKYPAVRSPGRCSTVVGSLPDSSPSSVTDGISSGFFSAAMDQKAAHIKVPSVDSMKRQPEPSVENSNFTHSEEFSARDQSEQEVDSADSSHQADATTSTRSPRPVPHSSPHLDIAPRSPNNKTKGQIRESSVYDLYDRFFDLSISQDSIPELGQGLELKFSASPLNTESPKQFKTLDVMLSSPLDGFPQISDLDHHKSQLSINNVSEKQERKGNNGNSTAVKRNALYLCEESAQCLYDEYRNANPVAADTNSTKHQTTSSPNNTALIESGTLQQDPLVAKNKLNHKISEVLKSIAELSRSQTLNSQSDTKASTSGPHSSAKNTSSACMTSAGKSMSSRLDTNSACDFLQYDPCIQGDSGIKKIIKGQVPQMPVTINHPSGRLGVVRVRQKVNTESSIPKLKAMRLRLDQSIERNSRYLANTAEETQKPSDDECHSPKQHDNKSLAKKESDVCEDFRTIQDLLKRSQSEKMKAKKEQILDGKGIDDVKLSDLIQTRQDVPLVMHLHEKRRLKAERELILLKQQLRQQQEQLRIERERFEARKQHENFKLQSLAPSYHSRSVYGQSLSRMSTSWYHTPDHPLGSPLTINNNIHGVYRDPYNRTSGSVHSNMYNNEYPIAHNNAMTSTPSQRACRINNQYAESTNTANIYQFYPTDTSCAYSSRAGSAKSIQNMAATSGYTYNTLAKHRATRDENNPLRSNTINGKAPTNGFGTESRSDQASQRHSTNSCASWWQRDSKQTSCGHNINAGAYPESLSQYTRSPTCSMTSAGRSTGTMTPRSYSTPKQSHQYMGSSHARSIIHDVPPVPMLPPGVATANMRMQRELTRTSSFSQGTARGSQSAALKYNEGKSTSIDQYIHYYNNNNNNSHYNNSNCNNIEEAIRSKSNRKSKKRSEMRREEPTLMKYMDIARSSGIFPSRHDEKSPLHPRIIKEKQWRQTDNESKIQGNGSLLVNRVQESEMQRGEFMNKVKKRYTDRFKSQKYTLNPSIYNNY